MAERFFGTLVAMSKSVDGQLGGRREDFLATRAKLRERMAAAEAAGDKEQYRAAESELHLATERYHSGRAGSLRFKSGLDEWIVEVRTLLRTYRRSS